MGSGYGEDPFTVGGANIIPLDADQKRSDSETSSDDPPVSSSPGGSFSFGSDSTG
jgi:hypothetical protein